MLCGRLTDPFASHPCFSPGAHAKYGRIHLPVAPCCNIQCRYCDRRYDCANESRPGVTSRVLTPGEALAWTKAALLREPRLRVVGIAGPGEPLFNPETFETFRLVREECPAMLRCVSTNGLLLPEKLEELEDCGISTLTVTINTLRPKTGERIYRLSAGQVEELLAAQQEGILRACARGFITKINTVLIPGVNDQEVWEIARLGKEAGAALMNVMPLIPCGELKTCPGPSTVLLNQVRRQTAAWLPQFRHCRQCRADACGVPGEETHL